MFKALSAAALIGLLAVSAPAMANRPTTPAGSVTHHEFTQATRGATKAQITALYGATPHRLESWYGTAGHFNVAFKYRAVNGTWTDATFRDWSDCGASLKLVHKNWYTPSGRVEHQ